MNFRRFILIAAAAILLSGNLQALPPMEAPLDRARNSDVVIHVVVTSSQQTGLNSVVSAVQLGIQVQQVLKASPGFEAGTLRVLNFLIAPQSFESGLREPPGPGHWVVFLNIKRQQVDGRTIAVPVLYSPQAFAFHPYDEELGQEIRKLP
ncbi:MAG: hypothetical protein CMN76_18580 [Spirochaetaceae bacterium]|nr:hypothetical protein [Spirochaetaceae bacterium]|tara:strand:- start:312035 stop:312484 length:450 start_codon:yes stop_codon:yes gene_type:complete